MYQFVLMRHRPGQSTFVKGHCPDQMFLQLYLALSHPLLVRYLPPIGAVKHKCVTAKVGFASVVSGNPIDLL